MGEKSIGPQPVGWEYCGCDDDHYVARTFCACGCEAYRQQHDPDAGEWIHWQDQHWLLPCAFNHALETIGDIEAVVTEEANAISPLTEEQIAAMMSGKQQQSGRKRKK